ncbi:hypothetical protein FOZ60_013774 [Perkinsus olseni]|nr:hypothetical protein FOZ60_013774 [Perkinsus olseni]
MSTSTANKPAAPRGGRKDAFSSTSPVRGKGDSKEKGGGDEHALNKEMDKLMEEHARIQERLAETKPPPVDSNEVGGIVDYDQDDDGAGGDSGEPTADNRAGRQQSQPRQSEELTEEQREKEAKARFIKSELGGFSEASPQIRESMKRNRRMFGNLLGHLGSAKQRLEKDRKRDAAQRQEECAQRVEAKLARQRNNLREIRRLEWEERRKQDRERLEQVLKEMEAKKIELLKIRLQSHYKQMTGFIRTNAQPSVFYLPKHHNSESKELLEQTKQQIEQKIASIPYSFAEFGEPTVASAGDVEEEKEAAGKEVEKETEKAVEETQESPRKQVDEDMRDSREPSRSDRKRSRDYSGSPERSRSRRRSRSRSNTRRRSSPSRRRSRRSSRDEQDASERRRRRASPSRSRSAGRSRRRRRSSASRERR